MKDIHILAGLFALLAGFIALYTRKGSDLHRRSGRVFTVSMLAMAGLGSLLAVVERPNRGTFVIGLLCCYLVATGYLTVKRTVGEARGRLIALMLAAVAIGCTGLVFGAMAAASPDGLIDELPAGPILVFGSFGLLGALGDLLVLRRGHIAGPARLFRHLWRMILALWIATSSFFFGQAKFLPAFVRENGLHYLPILAVLLTLLFWLVRVRWWRRGAGQAALS